MPENDIFIIVDGGGAKLGSVQWLRVTCAANKYTNQANVGKNISVMTLTEFLIWVNRTLR